MSQYFDEGAYAFAAGMGFLDNPYLDGPDTDITKARVWIDGYVAALIAARKAT